MQSDNTSCSETIISDNESTSMSDDTQSSDENYLAEETYAESSSSLSLDYMKKVVKR